MANWDRYEQCLNELVFLPGTPGEAYLATHGIDIRIACDAFVQYHPEFGMIGRESLLFPLVGPMHGAGVGRYALHIDGIPVDTWYHADDEIGCQSWDLPAGGIFLTVNALGTGRVVIVQRPLDALSLAMCGVPALATCGYEDRLNWLPERLQGAKIIYLAYDDTREGNRLAWSLCKRLKSTGARIHRLKSTRWGGDWNAALVTHGPQILREALRRVMVPKHRQTAST
ncbi:MAG: toprim domain-containing protein [Armatimonadota bacterium]